jgi:hypothetical protein
MSRAVFLIVAVLLTFDPVRSPAQDPNPWGSIFDCAVDWFNQCRVLRENRTEEPTKPRAASANPSDKSTATNLPLPVRNVLDNPSPETAREYVLWSRQANERLAKASEYIAQATREINSEGSISGTSNDLALTGAGPIGLYYFFSPFDPTAAKDVAVLNNIWREGRIGVVGIAVNGQDEEIRKYANDAKPLFPIRRSDAEVKLVKPAQTPDLYLALPLERKMFPLGSTITETAITEAIGSILAVQSRGKLSPLVGP